MGLIAGALLVANPARSEDTKQATNHQTAVADQKIKNPADNNDQVIRYQTKLNELESKIDTFESDVTDGPNTAKDDQLKEKTKKLSMRKEIIEERIDDLKEYTHSPRFNSRSKEVDRLLQRLESDYQKLSMNNKNVR